MNANRLEWRLEAVNIAHLVLDGDQPRRLTYLTHEQTADTIRALLTAWVMVKRRAPSLPQITYLLETYVGAQELILSALRETTDRSESRVKKWLRSWYKDRWKDANHRVEQDEVARVLKAYIDKMGQKAYLVIQQLHSGSTERQEAIERVGWESDPAAASSRKVRPGNDDADRAPQLEGFAKGLTAQIEEAIREGDKSAVRILRKVQQALPGETRG